MQETVESRVELDIAQIKRNGAGLVVVEDCSIGEDRMPNAQVEDGRIAAAVAALECRKIGDAVLVDEDLRDRIVDANAVEVPFAPKTGNDAHACLGVLHLEQRRIGVWTRAIDGEAIEIDAKRGEMQIEILEVGHGRRDSPELVSE